jgi:long-subunit fatty acid transport protein
VEPRALGQGLRGPAHVDVTALVWNPAALGPLEGAHAYFEGAMSLASASYHRAALDRFPDRSGDPPRTFAPRSTRTWTPDSFLGGTYDFDPVTLGVGAYTPFVERSNPGDGPGSDYRRELEWFHLHAPAVAVAYRVTGDFYFGVGLNLMWSWMHTSFDRDLALEQGSADLSAVGYESQDKRQRVTLKTSGGPDFTGAIGFLYRMRRDLDIGVSWQIRPPPVRTNGSAEVSDFDGTFAGRASVEYKLPDVVHVGAEWRATERLATSLALRYVSSSQHRDLTVRASSHDLSQRPSDPERHVIPESIVFYRGFDDLWALDGAAAYTPIPTLQAGAGAALETSAVEERAVNPAQVDGPKVAGRLFTVWRPVPWLALGARWEATVMRDRHVDRSVFDPGSAIRCVDSGYDVNDCEEFSQGRALPHPEGSYALVAHRLVVGASLDRW